MSASIQPKGYSDVPSDFASREYVEKIHDEMFSMGFHLPEEEEVFLFDQDEIFTRLKPVEEGKEKLYTTTKIKKVVKERISSK